LYKKNSSFFIVDSNNAILNKNIFPALSSALAQAILLLIQSFQHFFLNIKKFLHLSIIKNLHHTNSTTLDHPVYFPFIKSFKISND